MLLQKGFHVTADGRAAEVGCRLLWRKDGVLQVRPPRQDELAEIDALFAAARARGWE